MTVRDGDLPPAGMCWFARQRLPGLLEAFSKEIPGVKEAEDIEYIHRMRVASRRLRAALPLFRSCFPGKQYRRWMAEITKVTRALGKARDADVQIAFLRKSLKRAEKESAGGGTRESPEGPAIRFLLSDLEKQRRTFQEHVLAAMTDLEKSGILPAMSQALESPGAGSRRPGRIHGRTIIPMAAALRIAKRLAALLAFEPWVHQPEAVAEHHAMRIAAKKLRYTLEVFGPLYRNNLQKPLARVKKVQEILGEIHDCDVWIDHITTLLLRERSLLRSHRKRPDTAILASLRVLLAERERERGRLYRRFVRYWGSLERERTLSDLPAFLDSGRKSRYRPTGSCNEAELLSALASPGDDPSGRHRRLVSDLALKIFDDLTDLHTMHARDRFLLSCAAFLHERDGPQKGRDHERPAPEQIYEDEGLPFDLGERAALSFLIHSLSGAPRKNTGRHLDLVPEDRCKSVLMLASILRVADGLDSARTGVVRDIRCEKSADGVSCSLSGTGDLTAMRQEGSRNTDLFRQVFGIPFVIA